MLIPTIEREQDVFNEKLKEFKKYKSRTEININEKNDVLENVQNL